MARHTVPFVVLSRRAAALFAGVALHGVWKETAKRCASCCIGVLSPEADFKVEC
jgi:hypothetical protein